MSDTADRAENGNRNTVVVPFAEREWRRRNAWNLRVTAAVTLWVVTVLAFSAVSNSGPGTLWDQPLWGKAERIREKVASDPEWVRRAHRALNFDSWFVPLLLVTLVYTAWFIGTVRWRRNAEAFRRVRTWLWVVPCAATYAIADWLENGEHDRVLHQIDNIQDRDLVWLTRYSHLKWSALAVTLLLIISLIRWPLQHPKAVAWHGPDHDPPGTDWRTDGDRRRIGISLSGGGIRSASFGYGVLQELRRSGQLDKADYLAAVSGGSYIAAAHAMADGEAGAAGEANAPVQPDPPRWSPGSPEERWLRARLRYLAVPRSKAVGAVGRLLTGVGVNVILIWLITFAIVRPIGWAAGAPQFHPGLRAHQPIVRSAKVDSDSANAGAGASDGPSVSVVEGGRTCDRCTETLYEVVAPDTPWRVEVQSQLSETATRTLEIQTINKRPGLVRFRGERLEVLASPTIAISFPNAAPTNAGLLSSIAVDRQPTMTLKDSDARFALPPLPDVVRDQINLVGPHLHRTSGLLGRGKPRQQPWIDSAMVVAALVATFALLLRVLLRPVRQIFNNLLTWLATGSVIAVVVFGVVMLALPRLAISAPNWVLEAGRSRVARSTEIGGIKIPTGGLPPVLGFFVLSIASISRIIGPIRKIAKPASPPTKSASVGGRALARKFGAAVRDSMLGIAVVAIVLLNIVVQFTLGAANGPGGRLVGFASLPLNDAGWWLVAIGVLAIGGLVADSHAWSLYPFYKRRLASAFGVRRDAQGNACEIDYAHPQSFTTHGTIGEHTQLVMCATANIQQEGRVPVGRKGVSFTLSKDWIGGPEVGWLPGKTYFDRLEMRRQMDVTVPAAIAISGAAVSPAMGKRSTNATAALLALLNVRLGVWLPHPQWLAAQTDARWGHRPNWPWFFKEMFSRHRVKARYLYVTDGGHWENLGFVELMRRGCTDIVAVSAAGDGVLSFATLGEAVGLARTDLGIEITIERVWELRPKLDVAAAGGSRQFVLDPSGDARLGRMSAGIAAAGSFTLREAQPGAPARGRIVLIEAAMIDGLPIDVHTYAEGHPEFPDISTGDQLFNHRDFDAYRVLGREAYARAKGDIDALFGNAPAGPA